MTDWFLGIIYLDSGAFALLALENNAHHQGHVHKLNTNTRTRPYMEMEQNTYTKEY